MPPNMDSTHKSSGHIHPIITSFAEFDMCLAVLTAPPACYEQSEGISPSDSDQVYRFATVVPATTDRELVADSVRMHAFLSVSRR